jgi:hypothetical protein
VQLSDGNAAPASTPILDAWRRTGNAEEDAYEKLPETASEAEAEIRVLTDYYLRHGYPDYRKSDYVLYDELNKLAAFDTSAIFNPANGHLTQTMHGLGLLFSYFPHWKDVPCGNDPLSLAGHWSNPAAVEELVRKTYFWQLRNSRGKWTKNRLRQNAKVYLAHQTVSNFRPTVAKYVYDNFLPPEGRTWDMSAGWGGRMLGFWCSHSGMSYIGTDPSSKTAECLEDLAMDLSVETDSELFLGETKFLSMKSVRVLKAGSEDYVPEENSLDLCFTSTPYFDTEKYSEEPTQSYLKFPSVDLWLDGFLGRTIDNCRHGLKPDGKLILNIADAGGRKLTGPAVEIAGKKGFRLDRTLWLELSSISGGGRKLEPIFVFSKIPVAGS